MHPGLQPHFLHQQKKGLHLIQDAVKNPQGGVFKEFCKKAKITCTQKQKEVEEFLKELANVKKQILKEIFQDIRDGMKELTLDDIKEILRIEVRKSILHSGHVSSGHKEIYDSMKKIESLETVYSREINMRKSLVNQPKEIRESVDKKLKTILYLK